MIRALFSAASGLNAQQLETDVIANNIANVSTPGFKRDRLNFEDLLYQTFRDAGSETVAGQQIPTGLKVGLGVRPLSTEKIFMNGSMQTTENPLDLGIMGDGFFVVQLPDGSEAYTRDGAFKLDSNGQVVTSAGNLLSPAISIAAEAVQITISQDGNVSTTSPDGTSQTVGQVQLARFQNPGGLRAMGGNLFQASDASGTAELGTAGENGFGLIAQGYIENSNVQIVEEMVNLIIAQRAFESNSKAVQAADEMLNVTNSLKR